MILNLKIDGLPMRLIRRPLVRTADPRRAEQSRFTWGINRERIRGDGPARYATVYELTPLGILNRLIGLQVRGRS
jgi:hypothetical protein